jgi:hypothetical protein
VNNRGLEVVDADDAEDAALDRSASEVNPESLG